MLDKTVLIEVTAACQDGVTREGCSVVVREGQYVFLDADSVALEGKRIPVEFVRAMCVVSPSMLGRITRKYGPILR